MNDGCGCQSSKEEDFLVIQSLGKSSIACRKRRRHLVQVVLSLVRLLRVISFSAIPHFGRVFVDGPVDWVVKVGDVIVVFQSNGRDHWFQEVSD